MNLAYHEIYPEPNGYLYAVSLSQLDEHLRLVRQLSAGTRPKIPLPQITFDDGHVSNYRYAAPLLEMRTLRAIFFVTVGWTGVRHDYMNWAQLRQIVDSGHEVHSHGWSHVALTRCTSAQAEEELRRSKQTLEDKLGIAADALSIPHGRWDAGLLKLCARAGYRRVFTSNAWMRPRERHGMKIYGRLMMRSTTDARQLSRLLTLSAVARATRRAQGGAKEMVQRLLGDRLYHRIWCFLAGWDDPETMQIT